MAVGAVESKLFGDLGHAQGFFLGQKLENPHALFKGADLKIKLADFTHADLFVHYA